ncbi:4-alpha-glucanotransferase [Cumulibacter soli]|uniref:4-alpha-glucanotransferase n=1 Tax=Cumulibacter soli TaxID=2546344 RepID=UPI00106800AC|nr:4-alpha-glucanotransferase [Cumulibacter soli]
MTQVEPALRELAEAYGIAVAYVGNDGVRREVSRATVIAALAAFEVYVDSTDDIANAFDARRARDRDNPLPACIVVREGEPRRIAAPAGSDALLELEDGTALTLNRARDDSLVVEVPPTVPCGYHTLTLRTSEGSITSSLIVVPRFLGMPAGVGSRREWGFAVQIYSVRSQDSWAIGDFADLAAIAEWSAALGAGYVLTNPLHAAEPTPPMSPSPYSPTSRRFLNPIYIRPESLDEYVAAPTELRAQIDRLRTDLLAGIGDADTIDRDAVWTAKSRALRLLFANRTRDGIDTPDPDLEEFATWCAIVEVCGHDSTGWPTGLHDACANAVDDFARTHRGLIDFYRWLQNVAARQLAAAQSTAREAGMRVGIVTDLAVGVGTASAEVWADPMTYAAGVTIGAPGDAYNSLGQGWGLAAWRPDRLEQTAYRPFRNLVRAMLRGCGGIRIDHIMGLFRLWWIPPGGAPNEGTYVSYDQDAMVGVLMLEAQRADALIVGEDLGTVEVWVRDYLADRGILGTSVLWFENVDGAPLPPERYREYCMASVTTHDLAPTGGYLKGAHIAVRDQLGLLARPATEEYADLDVVLQGWRDDLRARGLLTSDDPPNADDGEQKILALHRYLVASPSRVLCAALGDAVGDLRLQNQPGTSDEYPNWRVPLTDADEQPVRVEDLRVSARAARLAAVLQAAQDQADSSSSR